MSNPKFDLYDYVKTHKSKMVGMVIEYYKSTNDHEYQYNIIWQNGKHSILPESKLGKIIEMSRDPSKFGRRYRERYFITVDYGNGWVHEEGSKLSVDYLDEYQEKIR